MKSDAQVSSGGKHREKKPARIQDQNSNSNLYDKAQTPPGASGDMAKDGYNGGKMKGGGGHY